MLAVVQQWERSGETRRVFARRHGVTLSCFDYWRRQLLDARQAPTPVSFAAVRLTDSPEPTARDVMEVVLASGERLVIREGVSVDLVRRVVTALRPSC
jgi:transposase-like protein